MSNRASNRAVKNGLKNQPNDFLACRDMRHAWDVSTDYFLAEDDNCIIRELECMRCHACRRDSFQIARDRRLVRNGTSYTYPEGYLMKGVPRGNKSQDLVRGEIYRRMLAQAAEASR